MQQRTSKSNVSVGTLLGLSVLGVLAAGTMDAQAPLYFKSLSVPPPTVGTCIEPTQAADPAAQSRVPHLVLTSRSPNARREMSLLRDSSGAVIGFSDRVNLSTGRAAGESEAVVAGIRADGQVSGFVMRTDIQMTDSGLTAFDSASLRRMRESAKASSSQVALDAQKQDQVRALVAWLSKRCTG